ncbi:conserved hypothetical protein [Trichinella spiralis]|uniref:hypothetical protein n=1 Tax=Trichinella spiralis TaxID=6334 RepID=UPI0001EFE68B|nr:conserved hypothetical protein [Trichinella spiralis]
MRQTMAFSVCISLKLKTSAIGDMIEKLRTSKMSATITHALVSAHIRRKVQSEEQGTSQSTLQGASNKKSSRCQLCEATDNKTPSRCEKKKQLSLYVKPIFVTIVRFAQKITCNEAHTKKKFISRVNLTGNMKHVTISEHDARVLRILIHTEVLHQ